VPQTPLTLHGRAVETVFDLLGTRENDITFSLGWILANCPRLVASLQRDGLGVPPAPATSIGLQEWGEDRGYTDVEIRGPASQLILEAKRGWNLPVRAQLERYSGRFASARSALLVVSECSGSYARRRLPASVAGVEVHHRSWAEIAELVRSLKSSGGHSERRLLAEFERYLGGVMTVQDWTSNWTYVVSIGRRDPPGWGVSFLDVVLELGHYFHPYGVAGWPKEQPNYLAFRWGGHVQRVHHVESYKLVEDLHDEFPEIPSEGLAVRPHIVYELGPPIGLPAPLPNGAQYRAARLWVSLDLLFTSATLRDALAETARRRALGNSPPP